MTDLVEKYLGEAMGRGMLRALPTRNPGKLEKLLKKNKIKFKKIKDQIMVGDDDFDDAEELMARNLLF
jgi:hypothetical protein